MLVVRGFAVCLRMNHALLEIGKVLFKHIECVRVVNTRKSQPALAQQLGLTGAQLAQGLNIAIEPDEQQITRRQRRVASQQQLRVPDLESLFVSRNIGVASQHIVGYATALLVVLRRLHQPVCGGRLNQHQSAKADEGKNQFSSVHQQGLGLNAPFAPLLTAVAPGQYLHHARRKQATAQFGEHIFAISRRHFVEFLCQGGGEFVLLVGRQRTHLVARLAKLRQHGFHHAHRHAHGRR